MVRFIIAFGCVIFFVPNHAHATFVSLGDCDGPNDCIVTADPPNPVTPNPDDGILLAWDEKQNIELGEDLLVDRVFDEDASFIERSGDGFLIKAGTTVSSHYLQWDPGNGSPRTVETTISLDSQVFAFIVDTPKLFASDDLLGLDGLDYNDFGFRGLEDEDSTSFLGSDVAIDWFAGDPGDWTRLITAFSPGGDDGDVGVIPAPAAAPMLMLGVLALFGAGRRRRGRAQTLASRLKR